jgi:hypothetical protein
LLIFIDDAEAFLCSRSNQSNAYVQAALCEAKSWFESFETSFCG